MKKKPQVGNPFALRIYRSHSFWLKLGPKIGGTLIKLHAWMALYKIFSNGGVEALAYVAYMHMLREGEQENKRLKGGKKSGPQSRVPAK